MKIPSAHFDVEGGLTTPSSPALRGIMPMILELVAIDGQVGIGFGRLCEDVHLARWRSILRFRLEGDPYLAGRLVFNKMLVFETDYAYEEAFSPWNGILSAFSVSRSTVFMIFPR